MTLNAAAGVTETLDISANDFQLPFDPKKLVQKQEQSMEERILVEAFIAGFTALETLLNVNEQQAANQVQYKWQAPSFDFVISPHNST